MQHQWKAQIKAQSEARLAVLQSRIRPHFLFNSLNTIAHLIRSAPDIAEELVQDLAELFRASLKTDAKPDLVLLDIRMPVMDGIEAAQALTRLDEAPAVIFVTAYDEHALQAFDANAIDYLLKPIRQARLEQALEKISLFSQARRQQRQRPVPLSEQQPRTHICATAGGRLLVIPVAQVRYCRADQKYVAIRTDRQELLVDESLKALAREFPRQFIRVHRNALVSVGYIETLEKSARGRFQVKLQGIAEPVEVSRRHLSSLRAILKHGLAAERSTPY